jgi:D-glucuronyl C5-epimerase C-terminus
MLRRGVRRGAVTLLTTGATLAAPLAVAEASPILRVGADGHGRRADDRFLPSMARTTLPAPLHRVPSARSRAATSAAPSPVTVEQRAPFDDALARARAARDAMPVGTPRAELAAVVSTAEGIDASGQLTPTRVTPIATTLRRNTEFWPGNPAPASGTRVSFTGSPVLFQYYPGQGMQIQPLANFGKANGLWSYCSQRGDHTCTSLRALLDAMLPLAAARGTFTAWEYYFAFEGGTPPWMSSMTQGTAIQALSRAFSLTRDDRYRAAAQAALGAFETAPPVGVARPAAGGTHYVMYSYAPDLEIFNGFLQSLVGLDEYRDVTGDVRGTTLFRAGHGAARVLVPFSDTGSWSLYSKGGPESTREYHVLLRDVLANLCKRIGTAVYCDTAKRFTDYLALRPG